MERHTFPARGLGPCWHREEANLFTFSVRIWSRSSAAQRTWGGGEVVSKEEEEENRQFR